MVLKPTTLPMWAEDDVPGPLPGQFNVVEPTPEKKLSGWDYKEFPVRNFLNWLGRWTYRNLAYLIQQDSQSVVTNGDGVGLFPIPGSGVGICILYAVDTVTPANFIHAVGRNNGGSISFNVLASNVLTIPSNPITGPNVPISGGTAANILANGQTKSIPVA